MCLSSKNLQSLQKDLSKASKEPPESKNNLINLQF